MLKRFKLYHVERITNMGMSHDGRTTLEIRYSTLNEKGRKHRETREIRGIVTNKSLAPDALGTVTVEYE